MNKWFFKYIVYYLVVLLRRQRVISYIRDLKVSQDWSSKMLETHQIDRLKTLFTYAKSNVAFYRDALKHIDVNSIQRINDITKLPCVSKLQIKSDPEMFRSDFPLRNVTYKTTGGSTGQPITIYKNADAMARELAATWRGYSWAGIDVGDRQGRFWGVPKNTTARYKAKLIDFVTNRRRCSAFSFTENDLAKYTKQLISFKPKYFYGYVSMIVEYADYFFRNNQKPPFDLQCIITTSEVLTDQQREQIETTFSTRVYNEYGSGELGSVAHECEHGSMHVMAENMIVEVLDGQETCGFNKVGELVITELNNIAMPLIRYRTGDMASISDKKCQCGRSLPVIENLVGRSYDMVRNKEGEIFHGEYFMYIFEDAKRQNMGIAAFKVKQIKLDEFIIYLKKGDDYDPQAENYIRNRIQVDFDKNATINYEYTDAIEREASGKMRLIVGLGQS